MCEASHHPSPSCYPVFNWHFLPTLQRKRCSHFHVLLHIKSQGKSCAGSTAGDHCSVQVARKASAWKAEEGRVPLIGRPGKEITGCHIWRPSTQCALPALSKRRGNNWTVPSPRKQLPRPLTPYLRPLF